MNDAVRMQVPHTVDYLIKYVSCHLFAETVRMFDETVELTVFCKFHDIITNFGLSLNHAKFLIKFVIKLAFMPNIWL